MINDMGLLPMRYLCLDQSTGICGWSLFENKKLLDYGTENFAIIKDIDKRIVAIKKWINLMIKEKKAEILAIEDIQYQKYTGVRAYKPLAELLGVLKNNFIEQEILFIVVKNGEWKKYCNIKGRERIVQKQNALNHIREKYGINVSEDVADAICIGEYVVNKTKVVGTN